MTKRLFLVYMNFLAVVITAFLISYNVCDALCDALWAKHYGKKARECE